MTQNEDDSDLSILSSSSNVKKRVGMSQKSKPIKKDRKQSNKQKVEDQDMSEIIHEKTVYFLRENFDSPQKKKQLTQDLKHVYSQPAVSIDIYNTTFYPVMTAVLKLEGVSSTLIKPSPLIATSTCESLFSNDMLGIFVLNSSMT